MRVLSSALYTAEQAQFSQPLLLHYVVRSSLYLGSFLEWLAPVCPCVSCTEEPQWT